MGILFLVRGAILKLVAGNPVRNDVYYGQILSFIKKSNRQ